MKNIDITIIISEAMDFANKNPNTLEAKQIKEIINSQSQYSDKEFIDALKEFIKPKPSTRGS